MPTATAHSGIQRSFGNITAGDITIGSFLDANGGFTIYYQKIGKLYFNFVAFDTVSYYLLQGNGAIGTNTADRIANQLGVTVNTKYLSSTPTGGATLTGSAAGYAEYNLGGTTWQIPGGTTQTYLSGFLAN